MNSPWARRTRQAVMAPSSIPGSAKALTPSSCPAARPVGRQPQLLPAFAWERPRPTPAARSDSLRPSPGRSASSRPIAAARGGGSWAFAPSLDQAGPIARTVRDAAILLKVMASHDPKDTTSVDVPVPDYEAAVGKGVKGLTIGLPKEYAGTGMAPEIEALWQKGVACLKDAGAKIKEVSLPHTKYALPSYYIVAPAEASSNLARYDGVRYGLREAGSDVISMYENTRAAGFGQEVRRRILIGTYVLSAGYYDAYYLKAQ